MTDDETPTFDGEEITKVRSVATDRVEYVDMMPELREAARESDDFIVRDDGSVTLADGVEEATLEVRDRD